MALVDLQPNQNAIINGDFNVWQRGTSFSSVANLTYTADRWIYAKSGVMVHDVISSTDVPTVAQAGRLISNSLKIDCTTIDSSIGSGDFNLLTQKIEGYNFVPLAQKAMTLSFWLKQQKQEFIVQLFAEVIELLLLNIQLMLQTLGNLKQ